MASKLASASNNKDDKHAFQVGFLQKPQSVAYTSTAGVVSNPVSDGVNVIRVVLTSAGFIKIGKKIAGQTLAATTSDFYVPADVPEYFGCEAGDVISAVQLSAGGTLYVCEMKPG